MPETTIILDAVAIQRALTRIAHEIAERNEASAEVVLVGIPTGGDHLAARLSKILAGIWNHAVPAGILDVNMHRDDLDQRAAPTIHPTVIPFDVTGRTVVLVDDVLFSGRTTRAAMDALNDFGRPEKNPTGRAGGPRPSRTAHQGGFCGQKRADGADGKNCACGSTNPAQHGRGRCWKNEMRWTRKHLLDIESLTADEITTVLDTARAFKAVGKRAIKKVPALRGKTVVNLFVEPSTRTRISFELAEQRLSADIMNFSADASSFKKGETLKDTARNLEALNADFIVIRHSASGAPHFLSRVLGATSSTRATARTSIPRRRCSTRSRSGRKREKSPG